MFRDVLIIKPSMLYANINSVFIDTCHSEEKEYFILILYPFRIMNRKRARFTFSFGQKIQHEKSKRYIFGNLNSLLRIYKNCQEIIRKYICCTNDNLFIY